LVDNLNFGSEQVRVANVESRNKSYGTLQSLLLCGIDQILNVFFADIIKINHIAVKQIIVYEIYVTVEVIKSKLIVIILKEWNSVCALVLVKSVLIR